MNPAAADIALRPATPADAPTLSALAIQVFLDTYAPEGIRPAVAREVLRNQGVSHSTVTPDSLARCSASFRTGCWPRRSPHSSFGSCEHRKLSA